MVKAIAWGCLLLLTACGGNPTLPDAPAHTPNERAKVHAELAATYTQRGQFQVALQEADTALSADPDYAQAWALRALVEMQIHQDAAAGQDFQQALRLAPNDADTLNNYGWFLCTQHRPAEALPYFDQAAAQPFYNLKPRTLANAGTCAAEAGKTAQAQSYFYRALRLDPSQPEALRGIAQHLFKQNGAAAADPYLDRLLKAAPPDAATLWLAIRIERALKREDARQTHERMLLDQFPDSPQAVALRNRKYDER